MGGLYVWMVVLISITILGRLFSIGANFTPAIAVAMMAGRLFPSIVGALIVSLGIVLSNIYLGEGDIAMPLLIGCSALLSRGVTCFEMSDSENSKMSRVRSQIKKRRFQPKISQMLREGLIDLLGALFFFIVSNGWVWVNSGMYPPTFEGIVACYTLALPFLQPLVCSTLLFGLLLRIFMLADRSSMEGTLFTQASTIFKAE